MKTTPLFNIPGEETEPTPVPGPDKPPVELPPDPFPGLPEKPELHKPIPEFFPVPNHPQVHPSENEEKEIRDNGGVSYGRFARQIAFVCLLFCFSMGVRAQQNPLGPHRGTAVLSGKYYIEMLGCLDHLEVYVFDKQWESLSNVGLTGDVEFFGGAKTELATLVCYGRDGFIARLPEGNFESFSVAVNLTEGRIKAEFMNECPLND
jgi:hypothetical protein